MLGAPQIDLNHLTEEERDLILNVLKRDEDLQHKDQDRVNALKNDIKQIKQKSALKPGDGDADKTCSRCRKPFGWIFDKGEVCPKCKHKVCETCQVPLEKGSTKWNCILCQKQRELDAMSGQWFYSKFRKSKRNRKTNRVVSGSSPPSHGGAADEVKRAMNGTTAASRSHLHSVGSGEGESSDTQSTRDMHRRQKKVKDIHDAAFPKDAEKIMLLDLLGGPSVGPGLRSTGSVSSGPESHRDDIMGPPRGGPIDAQVEVRRINARRYHSDSSSDDRDSAPSSPQMSHRTESEYAPSESLRSSFRSTSAISSDGRITLVTDNSGMSDFSTAPPSMQNSPALSNTSSIEQSHQHYMQVTNPREEYPATHHHYHQRTSPPPKSPTPKPRTSVQSHHQQQRHYQQRPAPHSPPAPRRSAPSHQEAPPRKSDSKSSADSAIDNPSYHSSTLLDSASSLSEETMHAHQVVSRQRSASSSSNEEISTREAYDDITRYHNNNQYKQQQQPHHHNNASANHGTTNHHHHLHHQSQHTHQHYDSQSASSTKRQAPPPPKPARSRNVSSSSETQERYRSGAELDEHRDGAESSADSASTLTAGDVTGEYDLAKVTAAEVANGQAGAGQFNQTQLTDTSTNANGSLTNQHLIFTTTASEMTTRAPTARARATALLAKHGRQYSDDVDSNDQTQTDSAVQNIAPNHDIKLDSTYRDKNQNDDHVSKPFKFTPRSALSNRNVDGFYVIDTPPMVKKHTHFAEDYDIIPSSGDDEHDTTHYPPSDEDEFSQMHDSHTGDGTDTQEEILSTSMESLEWDREPQSSHKQQIDPQIVDQLKHVLAMHGVGADSSVKMLNQSETSFQWRDETEAKMKEQNENPRNQRDMKDNSIEDAYFLEIDVDSLDVSNGLNQQQSSFQMPTHSDDEFSDSLSVIAEMTEPEDCDLEAQHARNASSNDEITLTHDDTLDDITFPGGPPEMNNSGKSKFQHPDEELRRLFLANKSDSVDLGSDLDLTPYLEQNMNLELKQRHTQLDLPDMSSSKLSLPSQEPQVYSTLESQNVHVDNNNERKVKSSKLDAKSKHIESQAHKDTKTPKSSQLERRDTLQRMADETILKMGRADSLDFDAMFEMNKECLNDEEVNEIMISFSPKQLRKTSTPVVSDPSTETPIKSINKIRRHNATLREMGDNAAMPSPTMSSCDEGYDSLRIKDPELLKSKRVRTEESPKQSELAAKMMTSPSKPKRQKAIREIEEKLQAKREQLPVKDRNGPPVDGSQTRSVHALQSLFDSKSNIMKPRFHIDNTTDETDCDLPLNETKPVEPIHSRTDDSLKNVSESHNGMMKSSQITEESILTSSLTDSQNKSITTPDLPASVLPHPASPPEKSSAVKQEDERILNETSVESQSKQKAPRITTPEIPKIVLSHTTSPPNKSPTTNQEEERILKLSSVESQGKPRITTPEIPEIALSQATSPLKISPTTKHEEERMVKEQAIKPQNKGKSPRFTTSDLPTSVLPHPKSPPKQPATTKHEENLITNSPITVVKRLPNELGRILQSSSIDDIDKVCHSDSDSDDGDFVKSRSKKQVVGLGESIADNVMLQALDNVSSQNTTNQLPSKALSNNACMQSSMPPVSKVDKHVSFGDPQIIVIDDFTPEGESSDESSESNSDEELDISETRPKDAYNKPKQTTYANEVAMAIVDKAFSDALAESFDVYHFQDKSYSLCSEPIKSSVTSNQSPLTNASTPSSNVTSGFGSSVTQSSNITIILTASPAPGPALNDMADEMVQTAFKEVLSSDSDLYFFKGKAINMSKSPEPSDASVNDRHDIDNAISNATIQSSYTTSKTPSDIDYYQNDVCDNNAPAILDECLTSNDVSNTPCVPGTGNNNMCSDFNSTLSNIQSSTAYEDQALHSAPGKCREESTQLENTGNVNIDQSQHPKHSVQVKQSSSSPSHSDQSDLIEQIGHKFRFLKQTSYESDSSSVHSYPTIDPLSTDDRDTGISAGDYGVTSSALSSCTESPSMFDNTQEDDSSFSVDENHPIHDTYYRNKHLIVDDDHLDTEVQERDGNKSSMSMDVLVDDASETAEERAHPEMLEENAALSLYLGPSGDTPDLSGRRHWWDVLRKHVGGERGGDNESESDNETETGIDGNELRFGHDITDGLKRKSFDGDKSSVSIDAMIDDASETADDRANPDKFEEEFAHSLAIETIPDRFTDSKCPKITVDNNEIIDQNVNLQIDELKCDDRVRGSSGRIRSGIIAHPAFRSAVADTPTQSVVATPTNEPHPHTNQLIASSTSSDHNVLLPSNSSPLTVSTTSSSASSYHHHHHHNHQSRQRLPSYSSQHSQHTSPSLSSPPLSMTSSPYFERRHGGGGGLNGSPLSARFNAHQTRGLSPKLSPYLAREGQRNSLERQRTGESTDSLGRNSRSSSRALTEAERTKSLLTLPTSMKLAVARDEDNESVETDDIDELVASHRARSMGNLSNVHKSNLLSPFSASVESVTSFYSDAGEGNYGKIPVTGEIEFGLDYNYKTGTLEVRITQCRDIACVDTKKKRSDPYVKTYLLPDRTKSGKRKTRVKKHTTNPVFNESIKYHISKSELEARTLWVTVWHNDTFGRNDFLGEVTIPLDYYEFKEPSPHWYKLQERNPTPMSLLTYKGDLSLQLKYISAEHVSASRKSKSRSGHRGELHVMVKQARNLTAVRANGSSDPFCKAYLMPDKGKNSKQKTPVVKKNCNPQWKHTFIFEDVSGEDLRERALELSIWDHDRFTSNDFLGGVRLSLGSGKSYGKEVEWCDSKGEEISLWQGMLDRPNHWVEGTLLLRPNMDARGKRSAVNTGGTPANNDNNGLTAL